MDGVCVGFGWEKVFSTTVGWDNPLVLGAGSVWLGDMGWLLLLSGGGVGSGGGGFSVDVMSGRVGGVTCLDLNNKQTVILLPQYVPPNAAVGVAVALVPNSSEIWLVGGTDLLTARPSSSAAKLQWRQTIGPTAAGWAFLGAVFAAAVLGLGAHALSDLFSKQPSEEHSDDPHTPGALAQPLLPSNTPL
jgi:hypothetical protein